MSQNQCDGCRRGLPIIRGIHQDPKAKHYHDKMFMYCTAERYPPSREQQLATMLEKATTRLEILEGRMRACGQHDVSMIEVRGWIEEQNALLGK